MSQEKVDQYKQNKADRKNWKKEQTKKKVLGWVATIAVVALVVVALVFIFRKDYSTVNTGSSVYDDVVLADMLGYDEGSSLTTILGDRVE